MVSLPAWHAVRAQIAQETPTFIYADGRDMTGFTDGASVPDVPPACLPRVTSIRVCAVPRTTVRCFVLASAGRTAGGRSVECGYTVCMRVRLCFAFMCGVRSRRTTARSRSFRMARLARVARSRSHSAGSVDPPTLAPTRCDAVPPSSVEQPAQLGGH